MNKIKDYIYVSGLQKAKDYNSLPEDIDKVINLSGYKEDKADLWMPLVDGENERERFHAAVWNTRKQIQLGNTVLVHCNAGVSRSVAVASTVIAQIEDIEFNEALSMIKSERPIANPHPDLQFLAGEVIARDKRK